MFFSGSDSHLGDRCRSRFFVCLLDRMTAAGGEIMAALYNVRVTSLVGVLKPGYSFPI